MAVARRSGGTAEISRPSMHTRPASGRTKPAMLRMIVVLPQPDGPRSVSSRPGGTVSVTSSTARTLPYCLTKPSRSRRRPPAPGCPRSFRDIRVEQVRPPPEPLVDDGVVEGHLVTRLGQERGELPAGRHLLVDRAHVPDLGDHGLPLRAQHIVDELRGQRLVNY